MDKGNDGGLDEGGGHGKGGQGKRERERKRKKEGIPGALGISIGCRI